MARPPPGVQSENQTEKTMKKLLLLIVFGAGLVLASPHSAFAQMENPFVRSSTTASAFNARSGFGGPPNNSGGNSYPGSAAMNSHAPHNDTTTATLNTGKATLAGALILVLLQRRYRNESV